jgi:hypothetical protein
MYRGDRHIRGEGIRRRGRFNEREEEMRSKFTLLVTVLLVVSVVGVFAAGQTEAAREPARLAVATGGTAGVYFPLGGAFANIVSEKVSRLTRNRPVRP